MKPQERQFWRVLNASAITYLNLAVLLIARRNSSVSSRSMASPECTTEPQEISSIWQTHHRRAARRPCGIYRHGPAGGSSRPASHAHRGHRRRRRERSESRARHDHRLRRRTRTALDTRVIARHHFPRPLCPGWEMSLRFACENFIFRKNFSIPTIPTAPPLFHLTVDGQTPTAFDPSSGIPNIIVKQGDVEDWIIENRSTELHAFHIHQMHFMLVDWTGVPVDEPFLRDTVNVPYLQRTPISQYPSVRLRMDFRDPNTVGTFVYHCHLLEHEDGGMMGLIRVEPADSAQAREKSTAISRTSSTPAPLDKRQLNPSSAARSRIRESHIGVRSRCFDSTNQWAGSDFTIFFYHSHKRTLPQQRTDITHKLCLSRFRKKLGGCMSFKRFASNRCIACVSG